MTDRLLTARRAPAMSALAVTLIGLASTSVAAQPRRCEISVLLTVVRFANIDPSVEWEKAERERLGWPPERTHYHGWTEPGDGLRFAYRWKKSIAFEIEGNLFRTYAFGYVPETPRPYELFRGWQKIQVLTGATVGHDFNRFHAFGRVRAGFVHFGRFPALVFVNRISDRIVATATVDNYPATFPALDVGGGVERFLWSRWSLRADVGDTIVRYHPAPFDLNSVYFRHNLQLSFSLGLRF